MHQGAEGYAIFPAGGKVLDVDPLFESRSGFMNATRSREQREKDACGKQPMRKLTGNTGVFQWGHFSGCSSRNWSGVRRPDDDAWSPQPSS